MEKISHLFWDNRCFYSVVSKQVGDFFKFLWLSQKGPLKPGPSLYITGNALGIWICGCRCILESSGSLALAHSTRSLKNSGCKRWCPKDLRVRAPALTHSLHNLSRLFDRVTYNFILPEYLAYRIFHVQFNFALFGFTLL